MLHILEDLSADWRRIEAFSSKIEALAGQEKRLRVTDDSPWHRPDHLKRDSSGDRHRRSCACRASMHSTGRSTLRSSCHSQLAIAPVSKPMRSACGARSRSSAVSAPDRTWPFPQRLGLSPQTRSDLPVASNRRILSRTVEGAAPTRRAISRLTDHIAHTAHRKPLRAPSQSRKVDPLEAKGGLVTRATSSRNGGRHHLGMLGDIERNPQFIKFVARFFPPIRTLHPLACHRFDAKTRGRIPVR